MPYSAQQYAIALDELSQQQNEQQQTTLKNVVALLKKERTTALLPHIIKELAHLKEQRKKQQTIRVTTAHGLTEQEKNTIRQHFGKGTYSFTENPHCIAGVVVQKNNLVFYATLSRATKQLEYALTR